MKIEIKKIKLPNPENRLGLKVKRVLVEILMVITALGSSIGIYKTFVPVVAEATIPKMINFQGKLTNVSNGTNVADGTYTFEFKLYDQASGGSLLWTETWDGSPSPDCDKIQVTNGVFSTKLGQCNALTGVDFSTGSLYLSVNFDDGGGLDGEMSPRKQLLTSAYAFIANGVAGDGKVNTANQSTDALSVGRTSANPALQVDTNTASSATGLKVTANAAGSGLALSTISSGSNENISLDAKGSGSVNLNGTATGDILLGGGSGSTGCTVTNSSGKLTCTSDIVSGGVLQSGSTSTVAYSRLGTGTTGHSLNSADDLLVSGDLEVDGAANFDGSTTINGSLTLGSALSVANGGTGATTFTSNGVLYGNGTSAIGVTAAGTTGQCLLATTGSAPSWGSCVGGGMAWSALTAPTANLSLAHGSYTTDFSFNGVTTANAMALSSSSLSSGTLLNLSSTSTAAASNTQKVLNISTSGANATSTQTTYGGYFSNTHTGTSSTNIAGYFSASGGTNNYAIIVPSAGGNSGFGTSTPTNLSGSYFGGNQVNPLWVSANDGSKVTALVVQGNLGEAIQFVDQSGTAEADFGVYTTDLYFVNRQATGNIRFDIYGSTSMFIDSNKNVGIGTGVSAPAGKLEVKGASGQLSTVIGDAGYGTGYAGLSVQGTLTSSNYSLLGDASNLYINRPSGGDISIRENNTAQVTIKTSSGNFGIGDTSPASLLTVGSGDLFQVNSSGAIAAATGITSSGTITFSGLSNGIVKATSGVLSGGNSVALGSEVSGTLAVSNGGTGATTFTSNGVLYGNGTSAIGVTAAGTTGQCLLATTGSAPSWGSCVGGGMAWSALTAPTANLSLAHGSYTTDFSFNGVTTANAMALSSSSLSSGTLLNLSSTSTAAASNTQKVLNISTSGANATSTQTTYGGYFSNTHTGTSSTNIAGYFSASGGTNNYAGIFENGNVGIGTSTPNYKLHVAGVANSGDPLAYIYNTAGASSQARALWVRGGDSGAGIETFSVLSTPGNHMFTVMGNGRVSIASTAPDKQFEINSSTGDNLRLTYNDADGSATNYVDLLTSSSGDLTVTPSGGDTNITGNLALTGAITGATGYNGLVITPNTGTITTGVWNGTALTDAYVSDTLTASNFVGSGSSTNAVDLGTAEVSGTLAVSNGGTGATTFTSNGVLYGNGTSAIGVTAAGTTGQCLLATTGSAPSWGSCVGGGMAWSALTAPTANLSLAHGSYTTDFSFNGVTTANAFALSSSSLSSGTLLNLSSTSTAAASNTQKVLNISTSGANATSTQTTYGGYFSNTHTGTSSTNIAGYFSASGGTNNYAAVFESGKIAIGATSSPDAMVGIYGGVVRIEGTGYGGNYTTGSGLVVKSTSSGAAYAHFEDNSGESFDVGKNNGGDAYFYMPSNRPLNFYTNGSERLVILGNGNIGMGGTLTPDALLNIQQNADSASTSSPVALNVNSVGAAGELTASSGVQIFSAISPVINQSSTAGYTALLVNATETATGSGAKNLLDLQTSGTTKLRVTSLGDLIGTNWIIETSNGRTSFGSNTPSATASNIFYNAWTGSQTAFAVQGASGQSANLFDLRNNGGSVLSYFDATGILNLGLAGTQTGTLNFKGTTSGVVTVKPQDTAGTYNFNLPTTAGTSGYLLTSGGGAGSPMTWTDPSTITAGAVAWDDITNPAGTQTLTFDDAELNAWTVSSDTETFWDINANSLTSGTALDIASSSLSSGSLINLSVASTAAASNTQKVLNISTSGANATSTQTTYGGYFTNTHTGTSSTNIAGYFSASGGTNNYAGIFENGNVGIGTVAPQHKLEVAGDTTQSLKASYLSTDNMQLSALEGGAYFGRTEISENQFTVGGVWGSSVTRDSVRNWESTALSSDGQYQSVTTYGSTIYTSSDYGASWTSRESSRNWQGIAMSADGKIQTAVVASGYIYTSSNYGVTWTQRGTSSAWEQIDMSSDGKFQTAVVNGGNIYTSYDYGVNWISRDSTRDWHDVAVSSDGKIQTAVNDGGYIYTSYNYGVTWTQRDSTRDWHDVAMSADGKFQTAAVAGAGGYLYVSSDYGATWTQKGTTQAWEGLAMSADGKFQTGVAWGNYVYASVDYGANWTQKDSSRDWNSIAMSSDGKIQVGAVYNGYLYASYSDSYARGKYGFGTTGPDRQLDVLDATNPQIRLTTTDGTVYGDLQNTTTANLAITGNSLTASSGMQYGLTLSPVINQSSTAGYVALLINATESALGSGTKNLLDLQVSSSSKFSVTNGGVIKASSLTSGGTQCLQAGSAGNISGTGSACYTGLSMGDTITGSTTGSVLFIDSFGQIQQDNSNFYWDDSGNKLGIGANSSLNGKLHIVGSVTTSGSNAVAGIFEDLTLTNSTASGYQFGNRLLNTVNGTTAGTHVGQFIRMTDSTSLSSGQVVRGLEVQAWSGTNNNGINTGIATYGKTFGLQAETSAQAGGVSQPAAVFAYLNNASGQEGVGNAIRAYTDKATTTDLVSFYQETSTFSGDALNMNLGNNSGTFSGNFISLNKAGTESFHIDDDGSTFVSLTGTQNTVALCHATNGQSNNDEIVDCSGAPSDVAEYFGSTDSTLTPAEVVVSGESAEQLHLDGYHTSKAWIARSTKGYQSNIIGVISTAPAQVYGDEIFTPEENPRAVALVGRVPVKVTLENGPIHAGDYLTSSATEPGKAMKATRSGMMIGQAISDYDGSNPETEAVVIVFVNVGFQSVGNTIVLDAPTVAVGQELQGQDSPLTNSASTFTIQQQTSEDSSAPTTNILQLQTGDQNRFMVSSTGATSILSNMNCDPEVASDDCPSVLKVTQANAELMNIDARGNLTLAGVIIIKDDTFAGSVTTDENGEAKIVFSYNLGTGKPVVQLTAEAQIPVFAQILSFQQDEHGNYTGFTIKTFDLISGPIQAIVHYSVIGKQAGYITVGNIPDQPLYSGGGNSGDYVGGDGSGLVIDGGEVVGGDSGTTGSGTDGSGDSDGSVAGDSSGSTGDSSGGSVSGTDSGTAGSGDATDSGDSTTPSGSVAGDSSSGGDTGSLN